MIAFTPRLWFALAVLVAVVVFVKRARRTRGGGGDGGGGGGGDTDPSDRDGGGPQAANEPDLFDQMQAHFDELDRAREQARFWSDDEVRLAVERYVFQAPDAADDDLLRQLAQQPERAAAHARRTLGDPDMQTRLQKPRRGETPWVRACRLLDEAPRAEHVEFVRPLLDASDADVRNDAWHWLAKIGGDDVVDDLARGLSSPDDPSLRLWILTGLEFADEAGRLTARGRAALVGPLIDCVGGDETRGAATFALRWDRERALRALTERGVLERGHEAFGDALAALAAASVTLPRDRLLALLAEGPGDDLDARAFAPVGTLLGLHRVADDEAALRRLLGRDDARAVAAAAGLVAFHDLRDWPERVRGRRDRLTEPERRLAAIAWLEAEVSNGGFARYFSNPAGDGWRDALGGLEEVEERGRAALLRAAVARFPEPPAEDRDRRGRQLAALSLDADDGFAELDRRYRDDDGRAPIEVVTARYLLRHVDDLRAAWAS